MWSSKVETRTHSRARFFIVFSSLSCAIEYCFVSKWMSRQECRQAMNWTIGIEIVAPLFIFMFVGYLLKKTKLVNPDFIDGLNKFSYKFTIPIVVFYNVYRADFTHFNLDLLWFSLAISTVILSVLTAIIHFALRDPIKKGAVIQGFVRMNQVLFAIPLLQQMYGDASAGVSAVLSTLMIPITNMLAVSMLTYYQNGGKISWKGIVVGIIKNPFIIATLVGLLMAFVNIWFPVVATYTPKIAVDTVAAIAAFGTPLALIALGAGMSFSKQELLYDIRFTMLISFLRLIVVPVVIVSLGILYGFRGVELGGLLIVMGSPSAVTGYQMAMQMGSDYRLTRQAIIVTTLLSFVTLSVFITILYNLGML